jgi:hypothetical protein
MAQDTQAQQAIEAAEVEPLADESLEEVAGGICSLTACSNSKEL